MLSFARFCGYCRAPLSVPESDAPTQEVVLALATPPTAASVPAGVEEDDHADLDAAMVAVLEETERQLKQRRLNEPEPARRRQLPAWLQPAEHREDQSRRMREHKEAVRASQSLDDAPRGAAALESLSGWWKGRVVVFDVETTGFGPTDSLIEIGAVEVVEGRRTGVLFRSHIRPHASSVMHPMARACHNLTDAFLASQPRCTAVHSGSPSSLTHLFHHQCRVHRAPFCGIRRGCSAGCAQRCV